jgi:hypothetical protein
MRSAFASALDRLTIGTVFTSSTVPCRPSIARDHAIEASPKQSEQG